MQGPIWELEGVYTNNEGEQVSTGTKTEAPEGLARKMVRRGGWKRIGEKTGEVKGSGGQKWRPVDSPSARSRRASARASAPSGSSGS